MHHVCKAFNAIDVLLHISFRELLHWIQKNIYSALSCHLHNREEVAVAGNKYDLIHNPILRERGNIETDPHINALLLYVYTKIALSKASDIFISRQQIVKSGILQYERSR